MDKKTQTILNILADDFAKLVERVVEVEQKMLQLEQSITPKDVQNSKPKKQRFLGKGVQKIDRGNLDKNIVSNLGDDEFHHEKGVTQIIPK